MLAAEEGGPAPASPVFTTLQMQLQHESQGHLLTEPFRKPNCLHVKGAERWRHIAIQRTRPRTRAPVYPSSIATRQHDLGQLSHKLAFICLISVGIFNV